MHTKPQTYLVGGAVRDALLDRPVSERDWVVVGATAEDMLAQGFTQVGKDFPVFLHPQSKEEYALARTERKVAAGYTGFQCDASTSVTLEQDLGRRDLTINAIAQTTDGKLIDPYNGQVDLNNRLLRHVSPAFIEDPLRVFRVARFAARFHYLGFRVAPQTLTLMRTIAQSGEINTLSAERVWRETEKALLESSPQVYFEVLEASEAYDSWFAPLYPCIVSQQAKTLLHKSASVRHPKTVEFICLAMAFLLPPAQVSSCLQSMRAPGRIIRLCQVADHINELLNPTMATPERLLALFNRADVWRREADFHLMLDAYAIYQTTVSGLWDANKRLILNALKQAKQVTATTFVEQGLKGLAIREAIEQKRLQYIGEALKL